MLHKKIVILLILFAIISCISIDSAMYLANIKNNLVLKQIIFYCIGFIIMYFFYKKEINYKHIYYYYIFGLILLVGLFFFGTSINNAKCWYQIVGFGTLQPSEFMKIILIILISYEMDKYNHLYNKNKKSELSFLFKIIIIVFIPSILTFLEPDTGVVLIYLIITFGILFIGGIRYKWFIIALSIFITLLSFLLITYFFYKELFINIFGNSFLLRIDRLLSWQNSDGYQLNNGLAAISSGGLFGLGLHNTPIYFPEPQTDFIFAVYSSLFGLIGSTILIGLYFIFIYLLIKSANKTRRYINKYIIGGFIFMLVYQIYQNIAMTIGLMPITGITLPFISYGGSSLLSYFIIIGIIINITKKDK